MAFGRYLVFGYLDPRDSQEFMKFCLATAKQNCQEMWPSSTALLAGS